MSKSNCASRTCQQLLAGIEAERLVRHEHRRGIARKVMPYLSSGMCLVGPRELASHLR